MINLTPGTYPAYYYNYLKFVQGDTIKSVVDKHSAALVEAFENVSEEKSMFRYAPGKWSLKEMLQHIIDTERIFGYRALSLARGESAELPGFDENTYATNSTADTRSWSTLLEEWKLLRKSTDALLTSFNHNRLENSGITNGQPNSVKAISFTIFGHALHHINVMNERYLSS